MDWAARENAVGDSTTPGERNTIQSAELSAMTALMSAIDAVAAGVVARDARVFRDQLARERLGGRAGVAGINQHQSPMVMRLGVHRGRHGFEGIVDIARQWNDRAEQER